MAINNLNIPTRSTGSGTPAADMNAVVLKINEMIGAIQPALVTLTGLTPDWDAVNNSTATITATGNVALTFDPQDVPLSALLYFYQDAPGNRTLTVNGRTVTVNEDALAVTLVGFIWDGVTLKIVSDYGSATAPGGGDTTAPTITSMQVLTASTIQVVFSEVVNSTVAGWEFLNELDNMPITGVTGSGSNTLVFTTSSTIAGGQNIAASYDAMNGDCVDSSGNELVSFSLVNVPNALTADNTYPTWAVLSSNLIVAASGLQKKSGTNGVYDYARSNEQFGPGSILHFTPETSAHAYQFGFTTQANPTGNSDFSYVFNLGPDGSINTISTGSGSSTYVGGDQLRLWYNGSTMEWQKLISGTWTTFATAAVSGSPTYYVMAGIYYVGSQMANIYTPTITPDTNIPRKMYIEVLNSNPSEISIRYNEGILASPVPAIGDFALTGGKTITGVSISGDRVKLAVTPAFINGEVGSTLAYTAGTNKIKDLAGNIAPNFTASAISNKVSVVPSFVTWNSLSSDFTTENSGLKKTSGGASLSFARTVETFGPGTYLTAQDSGYDPTKVQKILIGLTTNAAPASEADLAFELSTELDGTVNGYTAGSPVRIANSYTITDYFRIFYTEINTIQFQTSNDGVTWVSLATSAGVPSGNYYGVIGVKEVGSGWSFIKRS
jgi:hypothetical protein